jgi:signal transduction histidine kinase
MPSLGDAVARIPRESGLDPTVWFRVIVEGRQRLLRAPVRDELYRLVREAVVNAYRHSRAEEIDIEIEYQSTGLSVTIRDNGCGIDPEALRWGSRASSGLRWMRERSEQMGARLRIFSGVARGTEVELYVPGQVVFERS